RAPRHLPPRPPPPSASRAASERLFFPSGNFVFFFAFGSPLEFRLNRCHGPSWGEAVFHNVPPPPKTKERSGAEWSGSRPNAQRPQRQIPQRRRTARWASFPL